MQGQRAQLMWWVALLHRVSGVLLAIFLPIHFVVLGLAIEGEAALDQALIWSEQIAVKLAEIGLVFVLVVHLAGGLRILVLETLAWHDWQKTAAGVAIGLSAMMALLFGMRVF